MTQVRETVPERTNDNALLLLLPHNSLSTRLSSSPQTRLDPNVLFEMSYIRPPSTSPSRSRASSASAVHQSRVQRPKFSSVDLRSRESSQTRYGLYTSYEDLEMNKVERSTIKPRYVDESYLDTSQSNDDLTPQRETITTPPLESRPQLTPSTNTSSGSDDEKPQKHPAPRSPYRDVPSTPEEIPSCSFEASEATENDSAIKINAPHSKETFQDCGSSETDDMDNEECEFDDSEDDSFEERWVPTDEAFEASILRTTGNNLDLAARLIPQLYEMFQQEESFVVGFWETCYRTRVGNPYDQGAGMPGGWGEPFSSNTGQNTNLGKRQRENEEENSQGDDNQDGDRDGDGSNTKGCGAGDSKPLPFACPFNKKYPSIYDRFYRSPNGKGEYSTCESGFDTYQRFKEHLERKHRCVQCEHCGRKFAAEPKQRAVEFQEHRSNQQGCGPTPPDIYEGMTELQWAKINALPRQSRSTSANDKPRLSVRKWNQVWDVLFPREKPPPPWCKRNENQIAQMSLPLEAEKEEFRMCYNCALKDAKEDLNPEDMAVQAFQLWWAKWQAKHDALRRTQQSFSQMTLQENSRSQSAYPPREEGYFDQSMNFPNTFPFQERQEMTRNTSHPQPLQHSSIEGEFRNMVPPARQNATNSSLGHQIYGEIPMLSQALIAQSSPNVEQSSGQQTFYPSEHINPMMMGGSSMQQPNIYANPLGLPLGNQSPLSTKYDASGNSNSYPANHNPYNDINNNSTGFDVSGAPQIQQSYPAPPSQPSLYPLYATNPIQSPSVHQPQGYAPLSGATHNQTSPRQSMQPQQPLAFRKLQPDRTYPPVPPSYDDGYEE